MSIFVVGATNTVFEGQLTNFPLVKVARPDY
jgi:hypothetical protein